MSAQESEPTDTDGRSKRLAAIFTVVAIFVLGAVIYSQIETRRANQAHSDLYNEVEAAYMGSTSQDLEPLNEGDVAGTGGTALDDFLNLPGTDPDYFRPTSETTYEARYSTSNGGQDRCVIATWGIDTFGLARVNGSACTKSPA